MYCGEGKAKKIAWHDQNSGERTHRVGTKHANAFGLHDMSGNVWEWVQDGWHENYQGAPSDGKVWQVETDTRVLRGGSWYDQAQDVRAAGRINTPASFHDYDVGFRLARTLP
jgi:formylglycine-generating enzyme required for sulfatase activity